jgi:FlaA1/EpsC-like NDP-sugar epimerase
MFIDNFFKNKSIIVTGGVGSVGRELVSQLLAFDVKLIRVIDNNESGLFDMEMDFKDEDRLAFYLCDIRDEAELQRTFSGIDLCFHTAALKHVPACEQSPVGAINTNILGVQNIIKASLDNSLEKVLFTSSDKAVNPTNVMGTSKLMGERLFTAANFLSAGKGNTIFASTRFGNVAGSRGSVVPLFVKQIATGNSLTVTDDRMTRFMMNLQEASELVIESMCIAKGGEVLITKMPVMKIIDLALVMIDMVAPIYDKKSTDITIEITGSRPGEKLWEELSTEEESRRILAGEKYLSVLPAIVPKNILSRYTYDNIEMVPSTTTYHSDKEEKMSPQEIHEFLLQPGVLDEGLRSKLI